MSSPLERAAGDAGSSAGAGVTMRTPEDISEFCNAAVHRRMQATADDVIDRYKQAVMGGTPEQQIALTRAMLQIRNRRAALAADDRAGLTAALREFTSLALAPLPGGRSATGLAVPAPRAAPRSGDWA